MRVGAVLLAAGASRRFGPDNKLAADIGGVPLVTRVAATIAAAGVTETVAVTGYERVLIETALDGCALKLVHNERWEQGMGSSIAAGIAALDEAVEAAFIVPGDLPFLSPALLASLIAEFEADEGRRIVYPVGADGVQRNPVLWPRRLFPLLAALDGAEGGKRLLAGLLDESIAVAATEADLFIDLDTPDALSLARAKVAQTG